MLRPPVVYIYVYNVQISHFLHTSLVFVSECNTQSHAAIWLLLLQVPSQQPLDRAARWSFECCHSTSNPVSVYHYKSCVWFSLLFFLSSFSCIEGIALQCCKPKEPTSWLLIFSRKHTKRVYLGFMGVDNKHFYSFPRRHILSCDLGMSYNFT